MQGSKTQERLPRKSSPDDTNIGNWEEQSWLGSLASILLLCCSTVFGSRCVRRFEMLQLASMRFRESGAGEGARQIATQGRIFFQLAEIVWDAEHVRHQDVGDGKARGGEPFAAFEHPFELIETLHHPVVEWIFRCARHLDEPPRHGDHLHRVERRVMYDTSRYALRCT